MKVSRIGIIPFAVISAESHGFSSCFTGSLERQYAKIFILVFPEYANRCDSLSRSDEILERENTRRGSMPAIWERVDAAESYKEGRGS